MIDGINDDGNHVNPDRRVQPCRAKSHTSYTSSFSSWPSCLRTDGFCTVHTRARLRCCTYTRQLYYCATCSRRRLLISASTRRAIGRVDDDDGRPGLLGNKPIHWIFLPELVLVLTRWDGAFIYWEEQAVRLRCVLHILSSFSGTPGNAFLDIH